VTDRNPPDPMATLSGASVAERRTRAASRWFVRYMLLMGVLDFALIVATEALLPSGAARYVVIAAWALAVVLLGWWGDSHRVWPAKSGRHVLIATAIWFGTYLIVLGPLVRLWADASLAWWSVAAAVTASPFLIAAWWLRRRS